MDPLPSPLDRIRPGLLRQLRWHLDRCAVHPVPAEEALAHCLGALWMELAAPGKAAADWRRALRRVVYQEWERPARRAAAQLPAALCAPPERRPPEMPGRLQPWAASLLRDGPLRGRLAPATRRLGLSRRALRLRVTALARALSGDGFFPDLERRAARVLTAAARSGPLPLHRREARRILRVLALVEPPPALEPVRAALSTLAARRVPAGPGSRESASA